MHEFFVVKRVLGRKANFIPSLVGLAAKENVHSSGYRSKCVLHTNVKSHQDNLSLKQSLTIKGGS